MRGRRPSAWTGAIIAALTVAAPAFPLAQSTAAPPRAVLTRPPVAKPPVGGVDWQGAVTASRRYAKQAPSLAATLNPAAVDRTRVPILLPADAALMNGARIYSFGDYYTISADVPGAGVSLTGTTTTVTLPAKLKVSPQGPEQLVLQRTVDGHLASFVRYGVLYTAEIRCDSPADERCRTEAFARALVAKSTVVVLGKAARVLAGVEG